MHITVFVYQCGTWATSALFTSYIVCVSSHIFLLELIYFSLCLPGIIITCQSATCVVFLWIVSFDNLILWWFCGNIKPAAVTLCLVGTADVRAIVAWLMSAAVINSDVWSLREKAGSVHCVAGWLPVEQETWPPWLAVLLLYVFWLFWLAQWMHNAKEKPLFQWVPSTHCWYLACLHLMKEKNCSLKL